MLDAKMRQRLGEILADDIGMGDVTGALLPAKKCKAMVVSKEACILAGIEEARFLFKSKGIEASSPFRDGDRAEKGSAVLALQGLNRDIFSVERTALNVLARMSGVASACAEAKKIAGSSAVVALTRKTMPGFNRFDKKAAQVVGVWPHRLNLNSFVLLKDNHLPFFHSPFDAVVAAKKKYGSRVKVEIEVESLRQALSAAEAKPDMIMLDNLSPRKAKAIIERLKPVFSGKIELSGGISLRNLKQYSKAGPGIISMGCLTYSAKWVDFGLKVKE